MPSFTLLGPQVIRLPFILASSYPHEILHNWWGNSVFVDYDSGNWCEGLTAYLADHLIQEQGGRGAAYRRDALQRYRSYVSESRDFPLVEFRSRHSAATEAVGYGKTLMGFHMLRQLVGDDTFRAWLAAFYREERGRRASFGDVRRTLEEVSGRKLGRFFEQWTERSGAPALALAGVWVEKSPEGWTVHGTLRQTQPGDPYELEVPVVLETESGPLLRRLPLASHESTFELPSETLPLALHVDPSFDLFRVLDPLEVPPSIGQVFGDPRPLAILPSTAPAAEIEAYRGLIGAWRSEHQQPELVGDDELSSLPTDRAVWLLGRSNRFASALFEGHPGVTVETDTIQLEGRSLPITDHTFVVVVRNPAAAEQAVGWITVDPATAFAGLARKLPHYGKYSYLGFEGSEPTNVAKGQWSGLDSPLTVDLRPEAERSTPLPAPALEPEPPLVAAPAPDPSAAHPATPHRGG
ncbi:MAG: hypothetical protein KDD11_09000 [Acidobacteria bacterium]|nr:hypothetical protein [Acidobacteriota bacterium]